LVIKGILIIGGEYSWDIGKYNPAIKGGWMFSALDLFGYLSGKSQGLIRFLIFKHGQKAPHFFGQYDLG